jgi:hypothetical protein
MVLKLPLADGEVTDNIVGGLSPQQRTRFVLEARHTISADMDRLCIHERNLFAEVIRQRNSFEGSGMVSESGQYNAVCRHHPVPKTNVCLQRRADTCSCNVAYFYCKRRDMFAGNVEDASEMLLSLGLLLSGRSQPADAEVHGQLVITPRHSCASWGTLRLLCS